MPFFCAALISAFNISTALPLSEERCFVYHSTACVASAVSWQGGVQEEPAAAAYSCLDIKASRVLNFWVIFSNCLVSIQTGKEALRKALEANQRLQSRLRGIMAVLDRAIWRNAQTQAKLMHGAEAWPRPGRYTGMKGGAVQGPGV
jgi:hypothetical protein